MTYKEDCSTVTVEIESPSISTDRVSDIVSHRTVQGNIYSVKNVENVYDNVNEKLFVVANILRMF